MLRAEVARDRTYGYTRHGPHRADLLVKVGNRLARDTLSRGQQKLLVIALRLAQVALLNASTGSQPIVLIDDLASELDCRHRELLLALLAALNVQVVLTAMEPQTLSDHRNLAINWFHVEQGNIRPG